VKNLRRKLKQAGASDSISSVYGVGYRFDSA
jgi:DNA-binding response OmpR family regulator